MITYLRQSQPIEGAVHRASYASPGRGTLRGRRAPLLPLALGFFCFLPYPAFPIGGSSAIQIGNLLTLLACVPFLMAHHRRTDQPFWIYPALLAPLIISAVRVSMTGSSDQASLCFKTIALWALSALTITTTQADAPRHALSILTGVALATILHAGIGVCQIVSFASGHFPFAELYVNPSFLSVQDNVNAIARYTQRPFGLFPEPSAMAASLAPWVLLWTADGFGLIRLRNNPNLWERWLFSIAAVGGLGLIIASQSGHAAVTLGALLVFTAAWLCRSRATLRTGFILLGMVGAVLPCVLYFGSTALSERLGGKSSLGNSSWEERSQSLVIGLKLFAGGDLATGLFGMGAGLSAPALWSTARIDAVFSVLLTYLYETGVFGLMAVAAIAAQLFRTWKRIGFHLIFAAIFVVWLVGVTLTTSYQQLLPLWMTLGWLTVWPAIYLPARAARSAPDDISSVLFPPAGRAVVWSDE